MKFQKRSWRISSQAIRTNSSNVFKRFSSRPTRKLNKSKKKKNYVYLHIYARIFLTEPEYTFHETKNSALNCW